MRTVVQNNGLKIQYPDKVVFAYNPNYIEIEYPGASFLDVRVSIISYNGIAKRSKVIRVALYDIKAKVYLSRLFDLLFEEPEHTRSLSVRVDLGQNFTSSPNNILYSFQCLVIWGGIAPGERFNAIGVYQDNIDQRHFVRNLVWFKNFPFQVQVFKYKSSVNFYGRCDGGSYGSAFDGMQKSCSFTGIDIYTNLAATSVADIVAENVTQLVYFPNTKQLLAYNGGVWCRRWNKTTLSGFIVPAYSECVELGSNRPLNNVSFLLKDSDDLVWRYRFDGENMIPVGIYQNDGFVTLHPSELFPAAKRNATIKYEIGEEATLYSTFDKSFDYTFFRQGDTVAIVNLAISNETAGYYLRWIDAQGVLQFYLFSKGVRSMKTKLGSNSIVIQDPLRGTYFGNMKRTTSVELSVTHKCCAVHLPADKFEWISTIISSPIIDMFIGKDKDGNEIWVPVTIEDGTVSYDNKEMLHDLEISFSAPCHTPQSL